MASTFKCYRDIIPEFSLFLESLYMPIPTHLRINPLKTDPTTLVHSLKKKGIHLKRSNENANTLYFAPGLDAPGNLLEYFMGYLHPQALTSCLAALALCPNKSSLVLDMCAAPGGKTSHLASLMENSGLVVANELFANRHIPLGHTLSRLGALNVIITGYQAQAFPMRQHFDYVLADVPCSGEGRVNGIRHAQSYNPHRSVAKLTDLQRQIILRGFDLLKPGGEMLYSTCTYNPRENESVVNFLLRNRNACLLPIEVGVAFEPGITQWRGERFDQQVRKAARFYPHRVNSVGFFMARIGNSQ